MEGIEFIPLQKERLELVITEEGLNKPVGQLLLSTLASSSFKEEIAGLGGYELSEMGDLVARV